MGDENKTPIHKGYKWHTFAQEPAHEKRARYEELFRKLDVNKDGVICVDDLTKALESMGEIAPAHAEKILTRSDANKDGKLDLVEFFEYLTEHEKNLHIQFSHLDRNKDGLLDVEEIVESCKILGIDLERGEASKLLQRMDEDKSNMINWEEFRNFLLLQPVSNIRDILASWRHATLIDIGEDITVPDDFTDEELSTGMWWRHLIAGGSAGAVSRSCTAPLDRLKVLLQVHGSNKNRLGIASGMSQLLKEGGLKGMWRGNGVNIIKIAPESAIKFMAYEQMKRVMKSLKESDELTAIDRFMAGSTAGAISQTLIYPMEVLKTRLALRFTGQYSGIFDCAIKVYRQEGLSVFYRGYVPNLLGIIPYAGIDLMVYETLKSYYIAQHPELTEPHISALLLCGATSSTCGQLASYPLALIRTRMQAKPVKHQSMFSVGRAILESDGPAGLYRGIIPNFLKVAPAVSISYVVYEHCRKLLGVTMT